MKSSTTSQQRRFAKAYESHAAQFRQAIVKAATTKVRIVSEHLVADILQDVQHELLKKRINPETLDFVRIGCTIAKRRTIDALRKKKPLERPPSETILGGGNGDGQTAWLDELMLRAKRGAAPAKANADLIERLRSVIEILDDKRRSVLSDRMSDLTFQEIGKKNGVSAETARLWFHEAADIIRSRISSPPRHRKSVKAKAPRFGKKSKSRG